MRDYKKYIVFNRDLATYLLNEGYKLDHIEPNYKMPGEIVFIFNNKKGGVASSVETWRKHYELPKSKIYDNYAEDER